jgi:hypothetical protein
MALPVTVQDWGSPERLNLLCWSSHPPLGTLPRFHGENQLHLLLPDWHPYQPPRIPRLSPQRRYSTQHVKLFSKPLISFSLGKTGSGALATGDLNPASALLCTRSASSHPIFIAGRHQYCNRLQPGWSESESTRERKSKNP